MKVQELQDKLAVMLAAGEITLETEVVFSISETGQEKLKQSQNLALKNLQEAPKREMPAVPVIEFKDGKFVVVDKKLCAGLK